MEDRKIALYARVSTKEQSVEPQLEQLRAYAKRSGFSVYEEYVDKAVSGSKESRPALNRLMKDANLHLFERVVVWRFDRFARTVLHLVKSLEHFDSLSIDFVSVCESLDTSTPIGKAMFAIIGAMSQLERDLMAERTSAGMKRAMKKGVHIGRPKETVDLQKIRELKAEGLSNIKVAKRLGVSTNTVRRRWLEIVQKGTEKLGIK